MESGLDEGCPLLFFWDGGGEVGVGEATENTGLGGIYGTEQNSSGLTGGRFSIPA